VPADRPLDRVRRDDHVRRRYRRVRRGVRDVNDLDIRWQRSSSQPCGASAPCVTVFDAGVPLTLGPLADGCSATADALACTARSATACRDDQDDTAHIIVNRAATVWGGAGNATLSARGEAGPANVCGGLGDDHLDGDGEGGVVDRGPGDDVIDADEIEVAGGG
jgi:hypothetical protein